MLRAFLAEPEQNTIKQEFRRDSLIPTLSSTLPYMQILEGNKTIITKNYTLVRVLEITGFDNISTSFEKINSLFNERKNMFNNLSSDLNLNFFTFKKKSGQTVRNQSNLEIINKINDLRANNFKDIFEISLFVVINKKNNLSNTNLGKYNTELNQCLSEFNNIVERIKSNLSTYLPRELNNTKTEDNEGFELSRFITYLISNKEINVSSKKELYKHYATTDLQFEKQHGIINLEERFCQVINVTVNQKNTIESIFKVLLGLNIEFDICQNVSPVEVLKIKKEVNKKIEFVEKVGDKIATGLAIEDLKQAKELIENEDIVMLQYSCYIKVFANNIEELKKSVLILTNEFSKQGIVTLKETINSKWAFLSCLTDFDDVDSRSVPLNSENIADFIPFFNSFKGFSKNSFGNESVAQFLNTSNLVYNFNFHEEEKKEALGNTLIFGGTGAGKSTLLSFLLMNCLKYQDIKILAFDSKKGLKVPFTIFDGNYSDVSNPHEVILNPFSLPENLANRRFLQEFLKILAGGADLNETALLSEVVRQNYELLKGEGTLEGLQLAFGIKKQHEGQPNVAKRIEKWITDKDLSKYFSNKTDNLNFDKKINCFDMGDILKDEELLSPIAYYIFHKFLNLIKDNPSSHIFFIDEMARYLDSVHFAPHILRTLKEARKQNGIFIGCLQEVSTLLKSKIVSKDDFLTNTATIIIFPNKSAVKEDYQELGLNDNEFNFVKSEDQRRVLIKHIKGKSSIINTDFSSLGKYLKCFSSSAANVSLMEKLQVNNPDNSWLNHFLEEAH